MTPERTQLALRVAAVCLLAGIVQLVALSQLSFLGARPDVVPIVVMTLGLILGSQAGALCGFALGLFVDLALLLPPGGTSLILTTVGYGAGRIRQADDAASALVPLALGAAAAGAASIGYGLVQFLLGGEGAVSFALLREMLGSVLLGALLALPVLALVRRALRPALPEDPRRRRRRRSTPTTRGLSPLMRA